MKRFGVCKGCSSSVVVTDLDYELTDENSVSEEVYQERLEICMECPSLLYGTTCQHSGAIVHHRAMLADKHCPSPLQPQW
ncbi:hypothetical protein SAMN05421736_11413 [Evansella caseinilytica]|uniref:Uncharacterized protein n=1 Tax=Evansella caseinilytica TaxID=1503961 RepID=A0A1H3TCC1_9BACI|nr:DUF6171 family protein [Evansella caseinilytica]SDZ47896.1 hypothetical protein SAMN05421736_11413 [Evansella caseinilytica]